MTHASDPTEQTCVGGNPLEVPKQPLHVALEFSLERQVGSTTHLAFPPGGSHLTAGDEKM